MKKLPRWGRIGINAALIAVTFFLYYVFVGCPAFTGEQGFRRAERRNHAGPGEIIDILDVVDDNFYYDRLLLAETAEGYEAYCYRQANLGFIKGNSFSSMENTFYYLEKGEGVAILPTPSNMASFYRRDGVELPIIVLGGHAGAVRAELELQINNIYAEEEQYFSYSLRAEAGPEDYWLFTLRRNLFADEQSEKEETQTLEYFCRLWDPWSPFCNYGSFTLRLYDAEDALVYEESGELLHTAALAHEK